MRKKLLYVHRRWKDNLHWDQWKLHREEGEILVEDRHRVESSKKVRVQ